MDNKLLKQSNIKGTFQLDFYPVTQWSAIVDAPSFEENDGKVLNVTNNQLSWTGIKTINGESLFGDGNITVNAANVDWNENDIEDPAYILNRTHYVETTEVECVVDEKYVMDLPPYVLAAPQHWTPEIPISGEFLEYIVNGNAIDLGDYRQYIIYDMTVNYYGNLKIYSDIAGLESLDIPDTGEDFVVMTVPGDDSVFIGVAQEYGDITSISFTALSENVHKLDNKFLNDIPTSKIEGLASVALTNNYYSLDSYPTALSSFTNDSGYITGSEVPSNQVQSDWNETSGASPAYIRNKPSITGAGTLNTTATTSQYTNQSEPLSGNVTLHQISKTGKYDDLLEKRLYYFYWDGQDSCVKDLSDGSVVSVKKLSELHFNGWSHIIVDYNNFSMQLIDGYVGNDTVKFKIDYYDQNLNMSSADFCIGVSDGTDEGTNDTWTFETFVYASLSDANGAKYNTTAYWNNQIGFIPLAGEIIIYSDYHSEVVGNTTVYYPGIKIGSGNAYVQDLVFLNEDETNRLTQHLQDNVRHITAAERTLWNNKLNVETTITNETLVFTRN